MPRLLISVAIAGVLGAAPQLSAQVRLADESDRAAFRAWFVLLADAQFDGTTADVIDCAALVRHAVREALKAHTPEWMREARRHRHGRRSCVDDPRSDARAVHAHRS